jgi:hypothetical protein
MASRFDLPDAGTGLDSTQWDDKPFDPADDLPDTDPDTDPREPRRLGEVLDPMIVAERDALMAITALEAQVLHVGGVSRAFELYRIASRIERLASSLLDNAADRHLTLASQS